ncbi:MAG: PHP domain-containing protein [Treponema sp.]
MDLKKVLTSFHTHTYLCKHAVGVPLDYINEAKDCVGLGFSDHCPYPHDDVWNACRMNACDVPLYLQMVNDAKKEADFPVFLGFECEWLPRFESWYRDYLHEELAVDYLVFGSHWFPIGSDLVWAPHLENKKDIADYVDFTIQGLKTGLYDFLAHPDLFLAFCTHIDSELLKISSYLIDACIDLNIPIEINGAGSLMPKIIRDGREESGYPAIAFWEIARDKGATIICNSDAHSPKNVLYGAYSAHQFAKKLGIEVQDFLPILQDKLLKR